MVKSGLAKTACSILILTILLLHLTGVCALADDGSGGWRPVYDTIMLWVNFGILVYFLYRFGREPFKNFLNTQSAQISEEITKVENKKNEIREKIDETRRQMEESNERYEQIKARIIEQGEKLRESIIDDARRQAGQMLEREKKNSQRRLKDAKNRLMAELADAAANRAKENLPKEINQEDQSRMIDFYLENLKNMQA
ncbi:MAG: hypothetical protein K9J85_00360 [Desulfobacteraceae bacterium]|nr:hypothetical protein [Desulfobacteraceae bacterium]